MSTHFATSQRKDMRPLAFKGILVSDCHAQLQNFLASNSRFLEQHGMPKAASFLAEPVHDGNFGLTDWYTNDNAVPVPLASLPEAEQRAARARLADYAAALKSLMQSEAGQHSPQIVEILRRALQHPSAQDVYVADGCPVLINWGYAPGSPNTVPEDIMAPGAGNTAVSAVPAPQAAAQTAATAAAQNAAQQDPSVQQPALVIVKYRYGFLAWLLPILLLLAFLWLLLTWSGLLPAFLPQDLFRQTVSMNDEENKAQQLHAQADAVHDKLRAKNALCVPPKKEEPKPRPAPEPKPQTQPQFQPQTQPLQQPAAEPTKPSAPAPTAEPAAPKDAPAAEAAPVIDFAAPAEEPAEPKKKSTPPVADNKPSSAPSALPPAEAEETFPGVPKNTPNEIIIGKAPIQKGERIPARRPVANNQGLTPLHGCWKSEAGLMRYRDHAPITLEFCLKEVGPNSIQATMGEIKVYEHDSKKAIGKAQTLPYLFEQKLYLTRSLIPMPDGRAYESQEIMCTVKGNSMQCLGENTTAYMSGKTIEHIRWKAKFHRK